MNDIVTSCFLCCYVDYLEIPQRVKILNDRLKVISDLLSMLRDHLTNFGVEYQTLIIIYLIIIAVIVACVSKSSSYTSSSFSFVIAIISLLKKDTNKLNICL